MFPVLQLGPLVLPVPALAWLAGIWLSLSLVEREARKLNLPADSVYNLVVVGLAAGLIGARLSYAARHSGAYLADPLGLFSFTPATLEPATGALIGIVASLIYGARRQLPLRLTLDTLAPGLAVMGVTVAFAHLASGDAFGAPARLPWSIYLWDDYRHPAQVYELIGALSILTVWGWARQQPSFAGFSFLLVTALSAVMRVFLEAFRGDSLILAGGWRAAQVWSLVILAACLIGMRRWGRETET